MAICGSCGAEGTRIRTTFTFEGRPLDTPKDQCPNCKPEEFKEKFQFGQLFAYAHDAYPERYKKTTRPDGQVVFVAKDEANADFQARLEAGSTEEREKEKQAKAAKAASKRTQALSEDEQRRIKASFAPRFRALQEQKVTIN